MKEVVTYFVVIIAVFTLVSVVTPPALVNAQDSGSGGSDTDTVHLENPIGNSDTGITDVIERITEGLQVIAAPIVALAVLWGAFQMLFSGGSEEKFSKGKKTITYAVVGYVIILLAGLIARIIDSVLGG